MLRQVVISIVLSCFTQQANAFWAIRAHRGKIVMPHVKRRVAKPRRMKMKIYGVHS